MLGGLLPFLGGCAAQAMGTLRGGENAAYAVSNNSKYDIESVEIVSVDKFKQSLGGQSYQNANPAFKFGFGGNQYMSDTGHIVPESVLVSWRELPEAAQPPYTGTLHGPHKVQIRQRIPKEVLATARKNGLTVQISLTAGQLPIVFHWMLSEYKSVTGSGRGIRHHCIGGDSFTDPSQKTLKTGVDYREGVSFDVYTPVWPNCKLR